MKEKLLRYVSVLLISTALLTFFSIEFANYYQYMRDMKDEVRTEADYIRSGYDVSGETYLNVAAAYNPDTRFTLIDPDGTVLYDSAEEAASMENHKDRQEVKEALASGHGESERTSVTLDRKTYYYALKADDGCILRVACQTATVWSNMMESLTLITLVLIAAAILAIFIIHRLIQSMVRPINEIDLEHPLERKTYKELTPLLTRIDQQNQEHETTEQIRREFSANVSHEMKTPLMSISGYAELIQNRMVDEKNIPEFAGRIHSEATRLSDLVEDIMRLSRLDEMTELPEKQDVNLYETTQKVLHALEYAAHQKKITVVLGGNEDAVVQGHPQILYEMFYNLCDNAIKYNRDNGSVRISVIQQRDGICWSVTDTGVGIAKEDQERIFERFYRADKSHSREIGGTGLGLSIVKHAAAVHNAKIEVTSEVGSGTTIKVLF